MSWWGAYVGLPFGDGAEAVTCWSLVCRVYREHLGVSLPAYGEISHSDLIAVARAMRDRKDDGWRIVGAPQPFDVCLMTSGGGREIVHVGVVTVPGRILHAERMTGAVVVPVSHFSVSGRIKGYRRRAA